MYVITRARLSTTRRGVSDSCRFFKFVTPIIYLYPWKKKINKLNESLSISFQGPRVYYFYIHYTQNKSRIEFSHNSFTSIPTYIGIDTYISGLCGIYIKFLL